VLDDDADPVSPTFAKLRDDPVEIHSAVARCASHHREAHTCVDSPDVVIFGVQHCRVLRKVFDNGLQRFGPAQGIRRVQAYSDPRIPNSADEPGEFPGAEGFIILKRHGDPVLMERRQDLPDVILGFRELSPPHMLPESTVRKSRAPIFRAMMA
jgi:hypothetical protein